MFSSDYESLLLKMTAPTDSRVNNNDLEQFLATIETFVRNMDVTSQSNPYRVTLRKLWTKMSEPDGRSALKGLFIMHAMLRYAQVEDAIVFKVKHCAIQIIPSFLYLLSTTQLIMIFRHWL